MSFPIRACFCSPLVHYFISKWSMCSFSSASLSHRLHFSHFLCAVQVSSLTSHTCTKALATCKLPAMIPFSPSTSTFCSTRYQTLKDGFYHDENLFKNLYSFLSPFANSTKPNYIYTHIHIKIIWEKV